MCGSGKKLVLFGAGKIGRSFIGQLFATGGWQVVFIDIDVAVIDQINRRGQYRVVIKGDPGGVIDVVGVRGVCFTDRDRVADEVSSADMVAVSIGQKGLPDALPLIGEGLRRRWHTDPKSCLDIIIAENMRNAADYFKVGLAKLLPGGYPLDSLVGLVETSIGKMVPIMSAQDSATDMLQVFAEPYNTLLLDGEAFKNPIPAIEGLSAKSNMKAWVDRKLFIHNLGHAVGAYSGYVYHPELKFMWEVLQFPAVRSATRQAMLQSAAALAALYPDSYTLEELTAHTDDLLARFANRALGDTVYRVGCDLMRKLGPEDRLCGAIRMARDAGFGYDKILFAVVCGCRFRALDEQGRMPASDAAFAARYAQTGLRGVLSSVCGFDPADDPRLFLMAGQMDMELSRSIGMGV